MAEKTHYDLAALLDIMAQLRDPESGCPWDREQTFESIVPSTIEECYELADAIAKGDMPHVQEELGDVLFQVVFYSQLGSEQGEFDFHAVVDALASKLVRRHPHVFEPGNSVSSSADVKNRWEAIKQAERNEKQQTRLLDDVPVALPAMTRAVKLQKRTARVGFDWENWADVLPKIDEERQELQEALDQQDKAAIEHELGDMLFALTNLARKLKLDPETCLRKTNERFEARFNHIEDSLLAEGKSLEEASLMDMDQRWEQAKQALKTD